MAVYGEHLTFFPELFENFIIYKMKAVPVAGLVREDKFTIIRGVKRQMNVKTFDTSSKAIIERNVVRLWTKYKLSVDMYVEDDEEEVYRIKGRSKSKKEGDFYAYEIENVKGASTQKEDTTTVKWENQYD